MYLRPTYVLAAMSSSRSDEASLKKTRQAGAELGQAQPAWAAAASWESSWGLAELGNCISSSMGYNLELVVSG